MSHAQSAQARAATFVRAALDIWDRALGIGVADVPAPPVVHPIAEARFLSATAAAADHGLIGAVEAGRIASASTARLAATARDAADGLAWGLNFAHPHTGAPASDVDVVTTAWVALGLNAAARMVVPDAADLRGRAGVSLSAWPGATDTPRLPRMWSTRDQPPVVNAVALHARALHTLGIADPRRIADALTFVRSARTARHGWDFAPGRRSVDMVHSAYVIQSLAVLDPSPDVERGALEMLNSLRIRGHYRQRLRVRRPVVIDDALAEPRSLGEALTACADLAVRALPDTREALAGHARLLADAALDRFGDAERLCDPDGPPRIKDLAHLCVGMARAIPLLPPA